CFHLRVDRTLHWGTRGILRRHRGRDCFPNDRDHADDSHFFPDHHGSCLPAAEHSQYYDRHRNHELADGCEAHQRRVPENEIVGVCCRRQGAWSERLPDDLPPHSAQLHCPCFCCGHVWRGVRHPD